MKLNIYNSSLPHACDDESFNLAYHYGLVDRWGEGDFRVLDFAVFPEGVFNEDGIELLVQAISDGWNHQNFFYYKRLGVNWFTTEALESLISFAKPVLLPNVVIPERPERPDTPARELEKTQVLHGLGAKEERSPTRFSSIWDVGPEMIDLLDKSPIGVTTEITSDLRFLPPRFTLNGTSLPEGRELLTSGGLAGLALVGVLREMRKTAFNQAFSKSQINPFVVNRFNRLLCDHGVFVGMWFWRYQWPAMVRNINQDELLSSKFDDLCAQAYKYRPREGDVKDRLDVLGQSVFWELILRSIEDPEVTAAVKDWIDDYYPNRSCVICGAHFNLFKQKGWIYFGSNGAKDICFNCPIVKYPVKDELREAIQEFVKSCGSPPPDGDTPIDIRVTSSLGKDEMIGMVKSWSSMGGINHAKKEYGVSWFEVMLKSGALPDGTQVTTMGIKSVANDGCICLSNAERLIDDWLSAHGVPHEKEPLYPLHPRFNRNGLKRADWLVGNRYLEYFGLQGKKDYDVNTETKLSLARSAGIEILPIYPMDMINLDDALSSLID